VWLKDLKQMESLNLVRTKVTAAGVRELRESLRRCDITH